MYGGRIICHLYKVLKFVGKRFELTKIFELFKNVNVEFFGKEYNAKILNEDLMIIIPKKNFSLYVNSFLPDIFISDVSDHTGTMFEFVFPKVVRFILMIFTLLLLLLQLIILLNVRIGVDFNIIAYMPTWRGTLSGQNSNIQEMNLEYIFEEMEERLSENQIF